MLLYLRARILVLSPVRTLIVLRPAQALTVLLLLQTFTFAIPAVRAFVDPAGMFADLIAHGRTRW
eukprot:2323987-Alexandrium_andersonii.AAC.1